MSWYEGECEEPHARPRLLAPSGTADRRTTLPCGSGSPGGRGARRTSVYRRRALFSGGEKSGPVLAWQCQTRHSALHSPSVVIVTSERTGKVPPGQVWPELALEPLAGVRDARAEKTFREAARRGPALQLRLRGLQSPAGLTATRRTQRSLRNSSTDQGGGEGAPRWGHSILRGKRGSPGNRPWLRRPPSCPPSSASTGAEAPPLPPDAALLGPPRQSHSVGAEALPASPAAGRASCPPASRSFPPPQSPPREPAEPQPCRSLSPPPSVLPACPPQSPPWAPRGPAQPPPVGRRGPVSKEAPESGLAAIPPPAAGSGDSTRRHGFPPRKRQGKPQLPRAPTSSPEGPERIETIAARWRSVVVCLVSSALNYFIFKKKAFLSLSSHTARNQIIFVC